MKNKRWLNAVILQNYRIDYLYFYILFIFYKFTQLFEVCIVTRLLWIVLIVSGFDFTRNLTKLKVVKYFFT